jgi:16S rRNA (guanine966-N2)-methyltransferase
MRIVGGRHRGRKLLAPVGDAVRPTSDRAREAIFNILAHGRFAAAGPPWMDAAVLDVFAGTGALGLEALSRGAAEVFFIENARDAQLGLRQNIATLGENGRAHVIAGNATRPPPARRACRLAFLDPPYRSGLAAPALAALQDTGWFAPDALAVVEVARDEELRLPHGFAVLEERRYGAARVVFVAAATG